MGKKKHYPKDLTIPKEIVLERRMERKLAKKSNIIRKQKLIPLKQCGISEFKIKIPKTQKEYFEQKSCRFTLRRIKQSTGDLIKLAIRDIKFKYVDWFWNHLQRGFILPSLAFDLYPNVKEQSESVAALLHLKNFISNFEQTGVIVVADGSSPRTGFLFSLVHAKWIWSIDPEMNKKWIKNKIKKFPSNLFVEKCKIEDFNVALFDQDITTLVIVAVHAHVGFDVYLDSLLLCFNKKIKIYILSIACCVDLSISDDLCAKWNLQEIHNEEDINILSPKRRVCIFSSK